MRRLTLQLYLAKRFALAIFGAFLLCTTLIFIIDFVEQLRQAGKVDNVPISKLVYITVLRVPAYTEFLLPFAVLTGSIVTLLNLARKSELAVMWITAVLRSRDGFTIPVAARVDFHSRSGIRRAR